MPGFEQHAGFSGQKHERALRAKSPVRKAFERLLNAIFGSFVIFLLLAGTFHTLPESALLEVDCDICLRLGGGPCVGKLTPLAWVLAGSNLVLAFFVTVAALTAKKPWRWVGTGFVINLGIVALFWFMPCLMF